MLWWQPMPLRQKPKLFTFTPHEKLWEMAKCPTNNQQSFDVSGRSFSNLHNNAWRSFCEL